MWCPLPDPAQGGARSQALAPRSISRQRLALARQFVARSCQLLSKLRNEKGPQSEGGRQIADFVGEPCLQCIRQNALARTRPLTFGKPNKIHTLDAVSLFAVAPAMTWALCASPLSWLGLAQGFSPSCASPPASVAPAALLSHDGTNNVAQRHGRYAQRNYNHHTH